MRIGDWGHVEKFAVWTSFFIVQTNTFLIKMREA